MTPSAAATNVGSPGAAARDTGPSGAPWVKSDPRPMLTSITCSVPTLSLPRTASESALDQATSTTSTSFDSTRMGSWTSIPTRPVGEVRTMRARSRLVLGPDSTSRAARVPSREGTAALMTSQLARPPTSIGGRSAPSANKGSDFPKDQQSKDHQRRRTLLSQVP